jgi:hypothetical protein
MHEMEEGITHKAERTDDCGRECCPVVSLGTRVGMDNVIVLLTLL